MWLYYVHVVYIYYSAIVHTRKEERMSSRFEVSEVPADEAASSENGHSETPPGESLVNGATHY